MLNLLPEYKKKMLRRTYLTRVAVVGLWLVASATALGAVTLLPTYLSTALDVDSLETERAVLEEKLLDRGEGESVLEVLTRDAEFAELLSEVGTVSKGSTYMDEVIKHRPENVYLTGVRFTRDTGAEATLAVSGVADLREDLIEYSGTLEDLGLFSRVVLPLSDLTRRNDVEFSVTLVVGEES